MVYTGDGIEGAPQRHHNHCLECNIQTGRIDGASWMCCASYLVASIITITYEATIHSIATSIRLVTKKDKTMRLVPKTKAPGRIAQLAYSLDTDSQAFTLCRSDGTTRVRARG